MRLRLSEQRLSWWAAVATAGSLMVPVLVVMAMFGLLSTVAGDHSIAAKNEFWVGVAALAGYTAAIYLLTSLPGKAVARRMSSWAFSVTFHGAMVLFGATILGLGYDVAILLAPELIAVALSVAGLIANLQRHAVRGT